jgi:Flp pilus assembly protein TadD
MRRGSAEEEVMVIGRVRSRGRSGRVRGMSVAAGVAALLVGGCSGVDMPKLGILGSSTSALNIPERTEVPERVVSPTDAKVARKRLGDAATLAAARADPRNVDATLAAARILRRQGDRTGALELLDQAASAAPKDARLFRDRGLLALELGAVARARDHLQRAVANGSRDWQTHSALGTALAASGKQKDAQQQFAEALKQAPDNPVVLNNLALSLALDGRRGEAEQTLRRASAGTEKEKDARVAQNLALLGRLGGRSVKPDDKAVGAPLPPASSVPSKGEKKAAAPRPVRTAKVEKADP